MEKFPNELKELNQWVWYQPQKEGESCPPLDPKKKGVKYASPTDPETWGTYEQAMSRNMAVGFVLQKSNGYVVIDIDIAGETTKEQQDTLCMFSETYTEHSTDGVGYHIWCRGSIRAAIKTAEIEMYADAKAIKSTGNAINANLIINQQKQIEWLYNTLMEKRLATQNARAKPYVLPTTPTNLTDDEIIAIIRKSKQAVKFDSLMSGYISSHESHSEADAALIAILAFYTRDESQIKRLFQTSALSQREKATTRNGEYIDRSIRSILAKPGNQYNPQHNLRTDLTATKEKSVDVVAIELSRMIEQFNQNHALVLLDAKAMIMVTTKNQKGRDEFKYITTENFIKLHMNSFIKTGSKGSKDVIENTPSAWLKHPKRRQYVDGVVFEPSSYINGVEKPVTIFGNKLNLWRGFSVDPKPGNWQRVDAHIRDVICSGDNEYTEYLYNWIARCFQKPQKNGQVAVALKGEKGSGKSVLCNFINVIFGQHGLQVTNAKHLVGNFNAHLADCCFVFADEAFFAGDRQHENILKTLITEPSLIIERKGVDATSQPNRIKIMLASNNDWVVPASKDERRYFVLNVSSAMIGNVQYFRNLHNDIRNQDVQAAFLYDMLHRDISTFNVGNVPNTVALKQQREQSLDSFGKYWLDVLQRGYIYQTQHGNSSLYEWIEVPSTELIRNGYMQYCAANGIYQHRIVSQKKQGSYLTSWYTAKKRKISPGGFVRGETAKGGLDVAQGQAYVYVIGSREHAIKCFCEVEKLDQIAIIDSAI